MMTSQVKFSALFFDVWTWTDPMITPKQMTNVLSLQDHFVEIQHHPAPASCIISIMKSDGREHLSIVDKHCNLAGCDDFRKIVILVGLYNYGKWIGSRTNDNNTTVYQIRVEPI